MRKSFDRWLTDLVVRVVPDRWSPNGITKARIIAIPFIWVLYHVFNPWAATVLFMLVAGTDFIDGRLARGREMVSNFGKLLDIGCDLALVWSTVILLWLDGIIQLRGGPILFGLILFILIREIIVFSAKKFFRVRDRDVCVLMLGKCKTGFFMVGLTVLLTSRVYAQGYLAGTILLGIAAACSLFSGILYIHQFSRPGIRWAR